ncbi:MAG: hypothetical protein GMKNLPBB_02234 [Myxococcota bacterium]|nr:hypothetical protein [Myxococcota bacterium]
MTPKQKTILFVVGMAGVLLIFILLGMAEGPPQVPQPKMPPDIYNQHKVNDNNACIRCHGVPAGSTSPVSGVSLTLPARHPNHMNCVACHLHKASLQ